MTLPLWVVREHDDCAISAAAAVEADVLAEQVHVGDCRDTAKFLILLVGSLADERIRYTEALFRHDLAAADESAAEQRDLVTLARVCQAHLRGVGYRGER